ncbi:MAG TPA: GTP-binding protein [Planctomycetes bacterium]|nr:GTP-binding protein [Planctomycetota bacterium]
MNEEVVELTSAAAGAVRVVTMRGSRALERASALAGAPLAPGHLGPRRLRLADGEVLDECLVVVRGAEEVELHLHGAGAVVGAVVRELGGGKPRVPRTIEERAELALVSAPCEAGARVLLDQMEGVLRAELTELLKREGDEACSGLDRLLRLGERSQPLFEPPRVVLAGPVNAGKSTLFNALLGVDRAIVDPTEGTTRDAVREFCTLGPITVELVDTAGEREGIGGEGVGAVERCGQELARALGEEAALVLWIQPAGEELSDAVRESDKGPALRILRSMSDKVTAGERAFSALADPGAACRLVVEVALEALAVADPPWVPGRAVPFGNRERSALARARGLLGEGDRLWRTPLEELLQLPSPG